MRKLLVSLLTGLVCLSATHCATPTDDEGEEDGTDALSGGGSSAGRQGDDEIDVFTKDGKDFVGAFASPTIVRDGSTYHAWMAKQRAGGKTYNIAHAVLGADGKWTMAGDALPKLGKRAKQSGKSYAVWAPAVAKIDDGRWVLYYTATLEGTAEKKCLWRATAKTPAGPFVDDFDGPLECLSGSQWIIDPYLVKQGGTWHLAARYDEPGGINTIKLRELGPQGASYAPGSSWKLLTKNAPNSWEQPVLENAAVVKLAPKGGGEAHWFVFYSGRAWAGNSYAIGYADCGPVLGNGPCEKKTVKGPWLDTNKNQDLFGPGTPTFFENDAGETMMAVQTWRYSGGKSNTKNNGQSMRTYRVTLGSGYQPDAALVRIDN